MIIFTINFIVKRPESPIQGHIRIQDGDQIVAQIENAAIPRGLVEYQFPSSQYTFQRLDTCFTVTVEIERTRYPVDPSMKEFCANPVSWTLKSMRERRGERERGR